MKHNKGLDIVINVYDASENTTIRNQRIKLGKILEKRGIGEVMEQGTGEGFMDISLDITYSDDIPEKIKKILEELGLTDRTEIFFYDLEE